MHFFKKTLLLIFIAFLVFQPQMTEALLIPGTTTKIPSPVTAMNQIMADLGLDKLEIKKMLDNTVNVMDYKKVAPSTSLKFAPQSPVAGKELSALAVPSYFMGDPSKMYYTWYLKHNDESGSGTDDEGRKTKNGNTDWNEDGDIDIEDYKIEAMRILAAGDFDWEKAKEEGKYEENPNDRDPDGDSYESVFGGEDQKGKPAHCYVRDIASGVDYEMYNQEECKEGAPSTPDFTDAITDIPFSGGPAQGVLEDLSDELSRRGFESCPYIASEEGKAIDRLNINNKVYTVVSSTGWLPAPQLSDETAQACNKNGCKKPLCEHLFPKKYFIDDAGDVSVKKDDDDLELLVGTPGEKFTTKEEEFWHTNPESKDTNNDGVPDETALSGLGMISFKWNFAPGDQVGTVLEGVSDNTNYKDSSLKTMWGVPKSVLNSSAEGSKCDIEGPDSATNPEDKRGIYHFTKHGTGYCGGTGGSCTVTINCSDGQSATETFTNPGGRAGYTTCNCGGQEQPCDDYFTYGGRWPGCETGTMGPNMLWKAGGGNTLLSILIDGDFPDDCDVCIDPDGECGEFVGRMDGSSASEPPITDIDLNTCLEENLVDPAEGTTDKKIDVNLSFTPGTPFNDPSGANSDVLTINSTLLNVDDKTFVKYAWEFERCADLGGKDCEPISAESLKSLGVAKTQGLNLGSIEMDLKLATNKPFLKATLQAIENTTVKKEGKDMVIIPLQNSTDKIKASYAVLSESGANISFSPGTDFACTEKVCPVIKNEIIGLVSGKAAGGDYEFAWSLDGKALSTQSGKENITYFPVLNDPGSQYSVKLDVANAEKNEKFTLIRDFKVVDPEVMIEPVASADIKPLKLGIFLDPVTKEMAQEDFSTEAFEAKQGSTVTLKPVFNFTSPVPKEQWRWFVDGALVTANDTSPSPSLDSNGNLVLSISKTIGGKYNVSFETLYTQSSLVRKALTQNWKVPANNLYEKNISHSITVRSVNNPATVSSSPTRKIMASLFSQFPAYFNFLFRIVLTMALILFSTTLLFSIFPKKNTF